MKEEEWKIPVFNTSRHQRKPTKTTNVSISEIKEEDLIVEESEIELSEFRTKLSETKKPQK